MELSTQYGVCLELEMQKKTMSHLRTDRSMSSWYLYRCPCACWSSYWL